MVKLPFYDVNGASAGDFTGSEKLFAAKPNDQVVHSTLVWFQATQHAGTQSSLTRAEVRGGGKKPWKQKGTGRARAGSSRSPLWRKGGVIFAPKPRSYNYTLPKKIRTLALRIILSERVREEKLKVIEQLQTKDAKTKQAVKLIKTLGLAGKSLFIVDSESEIFCRIARNIKGVKLLPAQDLNIFDLMNAEWVVASKAAVNKLEEALV